MKRRGIDDEHPQGSARNDTIQVVPVGDDLLAEGERELGLDRVNVEALNNKDGQIHKALCLTESVNLLRSADATARVVDKGGTAVSKVCRLCCSRCSLKVCRGKPVVHENDKVGRDAGGSFDETCFKVSVTEDF